ncbi:MAG: hypothetical protein ACT4P7_13755 [Gemmatimonadaceae bacterium]
MSDDRLPSPDTELQFERAIPAADDSAAAGTQPVVTCSTCRRTIETWYFTADADTLCATCKGTLAQQVASVREWPLILRATVFGLVAAVAGAIVYYGVIAITELEIGLVAILIGYMVGYAVRKGARGRGGRRLQIAAVAITYFSVAMAYLPIAMKGATESTASAKSVAADSVSLPSTAAGSTNSEERDAGGESDLATDVAAPAVPSVGGAAAGIGVLLLFSLALPLIAVFGSLPSGLISALIIGFGMRQAWSMTGAASVTIQGPYRVGRRDPPSAAPVEAA